jgi:hypothetical protein
MKRLIGGLAALAAAAFLAAGCGPAASSGPAKTEGPGKTDKVAGNGDKKGEADAKIAANLAKLDEADRKLAEAQKYCVEEQDNRLGEMGVPVKVTLEGGKSVFVCCKMCVDEAKKNPDETLAKAEKMKEKAAKEAKQ